MATTATSTATAGTRSRTPALKSVPAQGEWAGSMATRVSTGGFAFTTDEPEALGGTDSAPSPMQYIVGAVNGCVTVLVEMVANELGIRIDDIHTESVAHMDPRGVLGTADVSPHFRDLTLRVRLATSASDSELATLEREVERRCPAVNLLRDAGVEIHVDWQAVEALAEQ